MVKNGALRLGTRARRTRRDMKHRLEFIKTKGNYRVTDIEEHKRMWSFGCMDRTCEICHGEEKDYVPF